MEQHDYGKALADMWALGKTFLEAQQQALRAMREARRRWGCPPGRRRPA